MSGRSEDGARLVNNTLGRNGVRLGDTSVRGIDGHEGYFSLLRGLAHLGRNIRAHRVDEVGPDQVRNSSATTGGRDVFTPTRGARLSADGWRSKAHESSCSRLTPTVWTAGRAVGVRADAPGSVTWQDRIRPHPGQASRVTSTRCRTGRSSQATVNAERPHLDVFPRVGFPLHGRE